MTVAEDLGLLSQQQAIFTQCLKDMLEGHWAGEPPSLEARVLSLNPTLAPLETVNYLLGSEAGPPGGPDWWDAFDPNTVMPRQSTSWTCSACALSWVLRATGLDPQCDEWCAVDQIGRPEHINQVWGLTNLTGPGQALIDALASYGAEAEQAWLSFNQVYALATETVSLMGGSVFNHWVAVRGRIGADLWIANSGPGWMAINSVLSRSSYERLGPFNVVSLIRE
jgi:hypothetical protein